MIGELLVQCGDVEKRFAYEELKIDGEYNQELFREWKRRECQLHCTCNPKGLVEMRLRKHPIYPDAFVLFKLPEPEFDHTPDCFRFAQECEQPVRRPHELNRTGLHDARSLAHAASYLHEAACAFSFAWRLTSQFIGGLTVHF